MEKNNIKQVAENTKDIYSRKLNILIKKIQDQSKIIKDFKLESYKENYDDLLKEFDILKNKYIKSSEELIELKKEMVLLKKLIKSKTEVLEEVKNSSSLLFESISQNNNKLKKEIIEDIDKYVEKKLLKLLS